MKAKRTSWQRLRGLENTSKWCVGWACLFKYAAEEREQVSKDSVLIAA